MAIILMFFISKDLLLSSTKQKTAHGESCRSNISPAYSPDTSRFTAEHQTDIDKQTFCTCKESRAHDINFIQKT